MDSTPLPGLPLKRVTDSNVLTLLPEFSFSLWQACSADRPLSCVINAALTEWCRASVGRISGTGLSFGPDVHRQLLRRAGVVPTSPEKTPAPAAGGGHALATVVFRI